MAFGAKRRDFVVAGSIPLEWRTERVLAPATASAVGPITDLLDPVTRMALEQEHAALLARYDMAHLDLSQITTKTRVVTQTISRSLFDEGASGIRFPSNTDGLPCIALFEGRAKLVAGGPVEPLTEPITELLTVCSEWGLVLREHDLPYFATRGDRRAESLVARLRWMIRRL